MPLAREWTIQDIETIRVMRADGATWDEIAVRLGCARWTAANFARRMGLVVETAPAAVEETDRTREPLPAGHPVSWAAICAGTCLEGEEYRGDA